MNPFSGLSPCQAALRLSKAGYHLMPLKAGSKEPQLSSWKQWQTKPTPPELIEFWDERYPGCNWALICGESSGLAVVDADSPEAEAWRRDFCSPSGVTVATSHGSHWWYRYPAGLRCTNLRTKGRDIAADIKAEGGYVVAPQSIHPDGTVYSMELLDGASYESLPVLEIRQDGSCTVIPENNVRLDVLMEGERDNGLASYAGTLYAGGFEYDAVLEKLREYNATRVVPPLPDRDLVRIARSIGSAEARNHPERKAEPERRPEPAEASAETPDVLAGKEGLRLRKDEDAEAAIPDEVLHPGGLLEDIMAFTARASVRTHPVFALAGAIAVVGTLAAQKVKGHTGLTTNVYCVALGNSGSGKDAPKQSVARLLGAVSQEIFAGSDVASDSAIIARLAMPSGRRCCYAFDEFGLFMQASKRQNSPRAGVAKCLTELFSHYRPGDSYSKGYADTGNTRSVPWHGLCLLGLSVPEEYWAAMQDNEAVNGFLSRQLCFIWDGEPVPRNRDVDDEIPEDLLDRLKDIWAIDGGDGTPETKTDGSIVTESIARPQALPISGEALAYVSRMEDEADALMVEAGRDGRKAAASIYNRRVEYGLKLSLIRCVSRLGAGCLTEGVSLEDVQWAFRTVSWCQDSTIRASSGAIYKSQFDRWCNEAEAAIDRYVKRERQKGQDKPGAPWRVVEKALKDVPDKLLKEVRKKLENTKRIWLCENWKKSPASKRALDLWCLVEENEEDTDND